MKNREAVVLSGCGCSSAAAYEVGVMRALAERGLNGTPCAPNIFAGSGFGGFNAAILASNAGGTLTGTIDYLEKAWLEGLTSSGTAPNGVYRIRLAGLNHLRDRMLQDPAGATLGEIRDALSDVSFLSGDLMKRIESNLWQGETSLVEGLFRIPAISPFFDMTPLRETYRKYVDLDRIRASENTLMVSATDWARGIAHVFSNGDMTDPLGHDVLQASAAYTLFFPFVDIGGKLFAGGPATLATPIRPVVETFAPGAEALTVHAIFLDPKLENVPTEAIPGVMGGMGRWFSLNEAENIHCGCEYSASRPTVLSASPGKVVIHNYRPSKTIVDWFAMAEFDREKSAAFISQGYADTLAHDCAVAECSGV